MALACAEDPGKTQKTETFLSFDQKEAGRSTPQGKDRAWIVGSRCSKSVDVGHALDLLDEKVLPEDTGMAPSIYHCPCMK